MHKDTSSKTCKSFVDFDAVLIYRFNFNFFCPWDRSIEVGDGETTLKSRALGSATMCGFFAHINNLGVEVDPNFFLEIGSKAALTDPDLR